MKAKDSRSRALAVMIGAFAVLTGCSNAYGPSSPPPPPPPPTNPREVDATPALLFNPSTLTVDAGDVVTFVFGTVAHNVFFDPEAGTPADIAGDNARVSVTRVFPTAGVFHFTCHIHPSMTGTVVVQ
ncbi:MAG TPA: plastocyanin/azurin family copper-binding protein [Gemmatimonadales bacterium]|jgi:plastocyanin